MLNICKTCLKNKKGCCADSPRVPFTVRDIKNIIAKGFNLYDFAISSEYKIDKNDEDWWGKSFIKIKDKFYKLNVRKINGKCFFLKDGEGCVLGDNRPLVCKIFPFWIRNDEIVYESKNARDNFGCMINEDNFSVANGLKLINETEKDIKKYFAGIKKDCLRNKNEHKKIVRELKNPKLISSHKLAVKKLEMIRDRVLKEVKRKLGKITEHDLKRFILREFKKEGLIPDKDKPIVAVNENSAIPHYFPEKKTAKIIDENQLLLIDIWARLQEKGSIYGDLSWIFYTGKNIPKGYEKNFALIVKARDLSVAYIKRKLKKKKSIQNKKVDWAARGYFKKLKLDKYFIHATGHSLGTKSCHGEHFVFSPKNEKALEPDIPFAIEPGLYFENKFGMRSEINGYVSKNKLILTSKLQRKITKI